MEFALRARIRKLLLRAASPALRAFADAIVDNDGARYACWGNLAEHVLEKLDTVDERLALWNALIEANDRRPMLLFLDLVREQPDVLRAVLADLERVPPAIQCALVSMKETESLLEPALPHLCAAALEIIGGGEDSKTRERSVYAAHMASLRGQRAAAPSCLSHTAPPTTQVFQADTTGDLP